MDKQIETKMIENATGCLAVCLDKDSKFNGWMFSKHPDDCIAEGAWPVEQRELGRGHEAVSAFRKLWVSTGGDWNANPWVWAIDFKVLSTTGRPA